MQSPGTEPEQTLTDCTEKDSFCLKTPSDPAFPSVLLSVDRCLFLRLVHWVLILYNKPHVCGDSVVQGFIKHKTKSSGHKFEGRFLHEQRSVLGSLKIQYQKLHILHCDYGSTVYHRVVVFTTSTCVMSKSQAPFRSVKVSGIRLTKRICPRQKSKIPFRHFVPDPKGR